LLILNIIQKRASGKSLDDVLEADLGPEMISYGPSSRGQSRNVTRRITSAAS